MSCVTEAAPLGTLGPPTWLLLFQVCDTSECCDMKPGPGLSTSRVPLATPFSRCIILE